MEFDDYCKKLPIKRSLSEVKRKILRRLWCDDGDSFPKPWVSSKELLELTQQKYFDRRTRELREKLGCHIETEYITEMGGHAWRIASIELEPPQDREYLSDKQKKLLFESCGYTCATCGRVTNPGVRGLQADHRIPLSRGGTNDLSNWQALCVACNVGKRRVCEGCQLDCSSCSWAFPDRIGIKKMINIDEETSRQLAVYAKSQGKSVDEVIALAITALIRS